MKNRKKNLKGFTLIETIVVISVFSILLPVIMIMIRNLFLSPKLETASIEKIDKVRAVTNKFIGEIRSAVNCAGGSTPLTQASDFQIVFCIDSKKGSADAQLDKDKIRYYSSNGVLYKGVTSPTFTGAGYVYTSPEKITTILTGLDTSVITPLFNYYSNAYDGSGGPLTQPITAMASIQFVKINLSVIKQSLSTQSETISSWPYRKAITISNANVGSNLTNFPLFVGFNSDADIGNKSLSTGYDIRFTDANGSFLPYERETWSGGGGTAASGSFWVKVPTISQSQPTTIYIYYGNSSANTDWTQTGSPTIAQSVWDGNYKGVWHFGDGLDLSLSDSKNTYNGINHNATATSGKINGGANIVQSASNYIALPSDPLHNLDAFTVEGWIYLNNTSGSNGFVQHWATGAEFLARTSGTNVQFYTYTGAQVGGNISTISAGTWTHFSFTYDGSKMLAYKDSAVSATTYNQSGSLNASATNDLRFGGSSAISGSEYNLGGKLDEVRISSAARSADWIKFDYFNQSSTDNELSFSAEQNQGAITSTNSFTITAGATIRSIRSQSGLGN